MRQTEDERIIRLSLPQEECGGGSRFCDGVGHGILDRNAVGYFWDWKKELAVSGAVESYLVILSQLETQLPLRQICYYSPPEDVGVFSTEIKTASSAYSTRLPHNGDETLNIIEAYAEYDVCF